MYNLVYRFFTSVILAMINAGIVLYMCQRVSYNYFYVFFYVKILHENAINIILTFLLKSTSYYV